MVKLDAVNYLLGILGSSPVGALSNPNPDVQTAVDALDAAIISVTSKGYWFNEVYNVYLTPDPITNKIDTTAYTKVITRSEYAVIRGDYLFSPHRNSYEFTVPVRMDGVALLDFDDLPDIVQQAVQFYAGVQLCTVELEDSTKRSEMKELYSLAFVQMKEEELEIKRINRQTSPRVAAARRRVSPARLNSSTGPNFGGR